jgi:hypothetical protein
MPAFAIGRINVFCRGTTSCRIFRLPSIGSGSDAPEIEPARAPEIDSGMASLNDGCGRYYQDPALSVLTPAKFLGELSRSAARLEDGIQPLTQSYDLVAVAGKPGMHPHGTFEEGLGRLIRVSNANA